LIFSHKTGPVLGEQVNDWQDGYIMIGNEVLQMFGVNPIDCTKYDRVSDRIITP
jgi:hypothetical protein